MLIREYLYHTVVIMKSNGVSPKYWGEKWRNFASGLLGPSCTSLLWSDLIASISPVPLCSSVITSVPYLLLLFPVPQAPELLLQGRRVHTCHTHTHTNTGSHSHTLHWCLFSLHLTRSHATVLYFATFY